MKTPKLNIRPKKVKEVKKIYFEIQVLKNIRKKDQLIDLCIMATDEKTALETLFSFDPQIKKEKDKRVKNITEVKEQVYNDYYSSLYELDGNVIKADI